MRLLAAVIGVVVIGGLGACGNSASTANDRPGSRSDSYIGKGIEKVEERLGGSNSTTGQRAECVKWIADALGVSEGMASAGDIQECLDDPATFKAKLADVTSPRPSSSSSTTTTVLSSTHNSPGGVTVGLYNAWVSGNTTEASNFATAGAIEQLFAYTPSSSRPAHANPECRKVEALSGPSEFVTCRFGNTLSMFLSIPEQGDPWRVHGADVHGGTPAPTTTTTTGPRVTPNTLEPADALAVVQAVAGSLHSAWVADDRKAALPFLPSDPADRLDILEQLFDPSLDAVTFQLDECEDVSAYYEWTYTCVFKGTLKPPDAFKDQPRGTTELHMHLSPRDAGGFVVTSVANMPTEH